MKLVLASSSVYRKQILQRLQLDFIAASPDIDESRLNGEPPADYVKRLSVEKSRSLAERFTSALIIGSDQVLITANGKIQGKPHTFSKAVEQLKQVRGSEATLLTGLALHNSQTGSQQIDVVEYKIGYKNYSDDEITRYLEREKPYDCAGALKSEGLGIALLRHISGNDPSAVIGLPLIRLVEMLQVEGYEILQA